VTIFQDLLEPWSEFVAHFSFEKKGVQAVEESYHISHEVTRLLFVPGHRAIQRECL
jgi:hypothetical protein